MENEEFFNIYCDESCHLLNDGNKVFVLGALWVEEQKAREVFEGLRALKEKHGLSPTTFEAKWTKISKGRVDYYCDLVKYFFDNPDLHYRGVVVPDKGILDHSAYHQDHNTWYYKMFYILLNVITARGGKYNLYLDIKDTRSNLKVLELKRILNIVSVDDLSVAKAQQIRSHEVELMQVVDILSGALAYKHRGLDTNEGKVKVVRLIEESIGKEMIFSSDREEAKFNVLVWKPKNS